MALSLLRFRFSFELYVISYDRNKRKHYSHVSHIRDMHTQGFINNALVKDKIYSIIQ